MFIHDKCYSYRTHKFSDNVLAKLVVWISPRVCPVNMMQQRKLLISFTIIANRNLCIYFIYIYICKYIHIFNQNLI